MADSVHGCMVQSGTNREVPFGFHGKTQLFPYLFSRWVGMEGGPSDGAISPVGCLLNQNICFLSRVFEFKRFNRIVFF